ncbi:hypothetical protein OSC27_01345 [Microbacterium sp. STN6]|uniref:hypothetical protein n=1 Tax=Microbacterium sp. STN6 TaxID=2995588 RepID=UPI002260C020|nr:hypothetical protein [Microbacterium sp. STN6]MCX7520916.1 hypothetical protein [Microbacterium sp. STN6]
MRKPFLAGVLLAAVAVLFTPLAASAENYVPAGGCTMNPTSVDAGDSGVLSCLPQTFAAGETVTFTVSGSNGTEVQLASYRTAATGSVKTTKPAAADGSVSLTVTVPKNAEGTYTITAAGAARTVTSSISVIPADNAAPAVSTVHTSNTMSLATLFMWLGIVVLVLVLAALVVFLLRRRAARV